MIRTNTCDDVLLDAVLSGDESSDVYAASSAHVESCPACQQRLVELAGDPAAWDHVAGMLEDASHLSDGDGFKSSTANSSNDAHLREVLDPPSHPEMLGRLGRYEIERVIGSGGMGVVLRGFDSELNRPVAIKVLARHLAHSGAARQRFARESRAAAAIVHEHVVAIHNVETSGETPFLVMQYVAGESLQARVDREGPLAPKETLRIALQSAAGLSAAHEQGVIHRDIKPANILLERGVDRALVTDFGLARTVDDASLTHTGVIAGTPHYMSPEQANGQPTDGRTDLFSLGAVMYFMATGRPPFRAERAMGVLHRICHDQQRPAWEINPDVPDELSEIIDALLQKHPNRRPSTAADVQQQLTTLLSRIQHRPLRRRSRFVRLARRHRKPLGVIASALVLLSSVTWLTLGERGALAPRFFGDHSTSTLRTLHQGANAPRSPADVKSSPMKTFSVETWQLASETEAARFDAALRDVDQALQQLESSAAPSDVTTTPESTWRADLHDLNQRLEKLQQDPFEW